jgi:galactokinase
MVALSSIESIIYSSKAVEELQVLYGPEPEPILCQQKRYIDLARQFREFYPAHEEALFYSTPGRTEIGGNHTDHQNGRVMCTAINLDILAVAAPNSENVIRLKSSGFPYFDEIKLNNLNPVEQETGKSAALIRGIAAAFAERGYQVGGLDIYTASMVPKGSGLSSSAAFEVLVATIINSIYNDNRMSPLDIAIISQYAENKYFGKPSGLMDQCGCAVGGFIAIDFLHPESPAVDPVKINFEKSGYGLVITHTGGSHANLTADYAAIPTEMREVSHIFGKDVLRDVDENTFWHTLPELYGVVSDKALLRAIHFFEENARVGLQIDALKKYDFDYFLSLVVQSGISSWTRLQNVWSTQTPDEQHLGLALALSAKLLGNRGASRIHGGGFAGTIQAFVPLDMIDEYIDYMNQIFGAQKSIRLGIRNRGSCEVMLT